METTTFRVGASLAAAGTLAIAGSVASTFSLLTVSDENTKKQLYITTGTLGAIGVSTVATGALCIAHSIYKAFRAAAAIGNECCLSATQIRTIVQNAERQKQQVAEIESMVLEAKANVLQAQQTIDAQYELQQQEIDRQHQLLEVVNNEQAQRARELNAKAAYLNDKEDYLRNLAKSLYHEKNTPTLNTKV